LTVNGKEIKVHNLGSQEHPPHGTVEYYGSVDSSGKRHWVEGGNHIQATAHSIYMRTSDGKIIPVDWELRQYINQQGTWHLHPKEAPKK
jgi:hypothetical protein